MDQVETTTIRKVIWRLMPFLGICYFVSWLDRVNVGFAALGMNADLGFSPAVFGLGAGIFFIGYVLCEAPSNLALRRFGARIWIARIMISWGILAGAMAFIQGPWSFYIVRFLLGIAEAGFFPGIIFYLTIWFPAKYRARAFGFLILVTPISGVIGAPLSGALFHLHDIWGIAGWRWMFFIEAIPAVVLGIVTLFYLTDKPEDAKWLKPEEREWLARTVAAEEAERTRAHSATVMSALKNPRVWGLGLVYLGPVIGLYGLGFWLPQIVQGLVRVYGISDPFFIGLIAAIPPIGAVICMGFWTRHSDRTRERVWHTVIPVLTGAVGLVLSAYISSPILSMVALTIALIGINVSLPVFWTMPTAILAGAGTAVGVAVINCIGNIGGYIGPQLIGLVKQATDSISAALLTIAALMVLAAIVALVMGRGLRQREEALRMNPAE